MSIIIENFIAQKFIEYWNICENLFKFDEIKIDKKWHETIIHDIEIEAFKTLNKMQHLQKEIEQWNSIKSTRKSMWLTKQKNRITKSYLSIKIALTTKNDLKNAIGKDMIIAETMCKTVKFISTKFET